MKDWSADIRLTVRLTPLSGGLTELFDLLGQVMAILKTSPIFLGAEWVARFGAEKPILSFETDRRAIYREFIDLNDYGGDEFRGSYQIMSANSRVVGKFAITIQRGVYVPTQFIVEMPRADRHFVDDPNSLADLINRIIAWRRPLHLALEDGGYRMNLHPLDRARLGVGWMGWLPFHLTPADVPGADLVAPMQGGTLVVPVWRFWQSGELHPYYSADAIRRTQDVELHLATLGVLPDFDALTKGEWPP